MGPDNGLPGRQLVEFLYREIHAIARLQLTHERPNHTLTATALVNELYLRLERSGHRFSSDKDFIPAAARMIRQILVDYARSRKCLKRGAGNIPVNLDEVSAQILPEQRVDLEALDEALNQLAEIGERQAQVVELRFFAGLGVEECAAALGVSQKTVKRDWVMARTWLRSRLREDRR
jgi:RNA polymerase sigma factor (TIGR02999 family)